jgi:hypothetical protein
MPPETVPSDHPHYRLRQALLAAGRAQDEADRLWKEAKRLAQEASIFVVYPSRSTQPAHPICRRPYGVRRT